MPTQQLPNPLDDTAIDLFADLEDLLAESMSAKADRLKLKEGRKTLKDNRASLSGRELMQLNDDIRRIELSREWLPCADVAMFHVQTCQCCGNVSAAFTGFFQRQSHRNLHQLDRWVEHPEMDSSGLPKEIKNIDAEVPLCAFCIVDEFGYPGEQIGVIYGEEEEEEPSDVEEAQKASEDSAKDRLIAELSQRLEDAEAQIESLLSDAPL